MPHGQFPGQTLQASNEYRASASPSRLRESIENCGHTAADDVAHAELIQRAHEEQQKLRFGHGGKCESPRMLPVPRTNRYVAREPMLSSTHAQTNRAARPAPADAPG